MKIFKVWVLFMLFSSLIYANNVDIDMDIIKQLESSGNAMAYNKNTGASGLYGITLICLKDFNYYNKTEHTKNDLFNPRINKEIGFWYVKRRIPHLLKHYNQTLNLENYLCAYNAGIMRVVNDVVYEETQEYIRRYKKISIDKTKL